MKAETNFYSPQKQIPCNISSTIKTSSRDYKFVEIFLILRILRWVMRKVGKLLEALPKSWPRIKQLVFDRITG
jgi:hypothetical protein